MLLAIVLQAVKMQWLILIGKRKPLADQGLLNDLNISQLRKSHFNLLDAEMAMVNLCDAHSVYAITGNIVSCTPKFSYIHQLSRCMCVTMLKYSLIQNFITVCFVMGLSLGNLCDYSRHGVIIIIIYSGLNYSLGIDA